MKTRTTCGKLMDLANTYKLYKLKPVLRDMFQSWCEENHRQPFCYRSVMEWRDTECIIDMDGYAYARISSFPVFVKCA